MVKGITKQVVVVRCPDTKYFDQAIFMVRDDFLPDTDTQQLLKEACKAADGYIRQNVERRRPSRWSLICGAAAAIGTALALALIFLL